MTAEPVSLVDFAEQDSTPSLDYLRAANARLSRQLAEAKTSRAELVAAVRQAALDAATSLVVPPIPKAPQDRRSDTPETALAVFSDWQLGKKTPDYDSDVCAERIERYVDKVLRLTDIQRKHHPVRACHVAALGDFVEGEMIFPGQAHRIDASLFRQVLIDGPRIYGTALRRLASHFPDGVTVDEVIGNHGALGGRARKEMHPESNADAMLYEATHIALQGEPRIRFGPTWTPGERHWYAVKRIGRFGFFQFHGDQVRGGFAGFPWYGFGRRLTRWSIMYGGFQYALSGHFHTPVRLFDAAITLWGNGSTESTNTYAQEELAASGEPCQWLLFVHPEQGVSAEYLVYLA